MRPAAIAILTITCTMLAALAATQVAAADPPPAAPIPAAPSPATLSPPIEAQEPSITLPADLTRVLADYESAWRSRDAAALARLFAEDGFVLPNGGPPVRGRAAIEKHYTDHGGPLALRALAFATRGDVGYIIGGYARQAGEPDAGKFTLTLRKGPGGRWLIVSDMDSSNQAPPRLD